MTHHRLVLRIKWGYFRHADKIVNLTELVFSIYDTVNKKQKYIPIGFSNKSELLLINKVGKVNNSR